MADLKILSGGAANGLVNAVRAEFLQATGLHITGDFGAVGGLFDRIVAGEAVDIVILSQKLMDDLLQRGAIVAQGMMPLGKVVTGIAVRDGQARPAVNDAGALKQAFLNADAIYIPDHIKSTAGIHVASVLNKLGIFETVLPRLKTYPNGQTAMTEMAKATQGNPIGCTQMTEILNTHGVHYVGDLPQGFDLATVYTAAQASKAQQPAAVQALISMLCSAAHAQTRLKAGFST
jgi:molybdate transport system substrate-binding protein